MAENARNGGVWALFMQAPEIRRAMRLAGFSATSGFPFGTNRSVRLPPSSEITVSKKCSPTTVEALPFDGWKTVRTFILDRRHLEPASDGWPDGFRVVAAFAWDPDALHLRVDVSDHTPSYAPPGESPAAYDGVELYVDPDNDGLIWNNPADFQFAFFRDGGFREWFGGRTNMTVSVTDGPGGYRVEAAVPWRLLGRKPRPGRILRVSVAVNNRYAENRHSKLNWVWKPQADRIRLGALKWVEEP